jgi:hypothetical protein
MRWVLNTSSDGDFDQAQLIGDVLFALVVKSKLPNSLLEPESNLSEAFNDLEKFYVAASFEQVPSCVDECEINSCKFIVFKIGYVTQELKKLVVK